MFVSSCCQVETLYGKSALWQEVQGVAVTSLSPGLQVRCSLTLQPKDSLTIGKVGLAFLAGLNHSHGHLWLGPFSVDVLSIGFQGNLTVYINIICINNNKKNMLY